MVFTLSTMLSLGTMKKIFFGVMVVVLLLLGFLFIQSSFQKTTVGEKTSEAAKKITVSQRIIISKENPPEFQQHEVEEGKTALDLLQKTSSVTMKGSGNNAFVTAIDTSEASEQNKEYWAFYVNGSLAQVGAGSYQLKDGDTIEWKIENWTD